jgi:small-conductance mechanosensitive channel
VPTNDFNRAMDVQQRINLEIMRCFAHAGIAFAFPTRTLQMVGQKPG